MLWQIINAHDGQLPDYVRCAFSNTGKEFPQSLAFVRDCAEHWNVDITWLEYEPGGYKQVDYDTAAWDGEPFEKLINKKKMVPNARMRFCTIELKIKPINKWMKSQGFTDYDMLLGIRADEPARVTKQHQQGNLTPMATAGHGLVDVSYFWDSMPFGLDLPINPDGSCWLSNCDLCFLKGHNIKQSIMRGAPELADWWIKQEKAVGGTFRHNRPDYQAMKDGAAQPMLFIEPSLSCFCGD